MTTEQPLRFDQLGLSEVALQAVADLGYDAPTPVQGKAIPAILAGNDVLAAAQTGTGKTAAFLLPTLSRLKKHERMGEGPYMLVVTPTRELAQQIEVCARAICRRTGHKCTVVVGGVGYEPQKASIRRGLDLLVATPGRLIDLMNQDACNLSQVEVLVLDEADRMLDMGFLPDMKRIVAKTPDARQTLLFSATLGDDVLKHTNSLVKDPVRVEIAHKGTAAQTIDQYALGVSAKDKVRILIDVLRREGSKRVIVFCRGKHRCDMVCRKLNKAGIVANPIHGNRTQSQRENALKRFAAGEADVLVATDVLARGIDIAEVSYVVNLDVPSDAEDYIHRIGRTGRAGEYGWALTFVSEDEYLDLRDIEALMGKLVPDFPRAEGIDLGEEPFSPDPARKPTDTLPNKKARKKMQAEREAARSGGGSSKAEPSRAPKKAAAPEQPAAPSRDRFDRRGSSRAQTAKAKLEASGVRTCAEGGRAERPGTSPKGERRGSSSSRGRAAKPEATPKRKPSRAPEAQQAAPRPRRRPGDHGGPGRK